MQKAGIKCPVRRLWISSLTDESIRDGFKQLKPEQDFNNLYYAGLSRAIGDWILGLNATRLYSLKYSEPGKVLSIGRVQTPTLSLVVQRQMEIDNFVPEDYWEIKTLYRGVTFNSTAGRYKSEQDATSAMQLITGVPLIISDVQGKVGKEAPLRLFDLTSLQVECNKRWGWSADESLKLIQLLYEKKVTTYPRVDTTYLSDDIYPKVPQILKQMTPYANLTASLLERKLPKSKKVFDNSKVTDHHAIIPTGVAPSTLQGNERKLYHLIALRFIAAFYPDCEFHSTTVNAKIGDAEFKATGKVITKPGWKVVYSSSKEDETTDSDKDNVLPEFTIGESGPHEPSLLKKVTQPPKYYTEGTLLRAMESAGKTVEDEELRDALKENGIGRPSTRAAIIETLFKRNYIRRERKNILATQAGIDLINIINEELLKSAKLTGLWENKLRRIERGEYSAAEFIEELKQLINGIVLSVMQDNSYHRIVIEDTDKKVGKKENAKSQKGTVTKTKAKRITKLEQVVCPKCKQGHLLSGNAAYGCSRYKEGCNLILPYDKYSKELTPSALNKLLKKSFSDD